MKYYSPGDRIAGPKPPGNRGLFFYGHPSLHLQQVGLNALAFFFGNPSQLRLRGSGDEQVPVH